MIAAHDPSPDRLSVKYGTRLDRSPRVVQLLAALLYDELRGSVDGARDRVKVGALFLLAAKKPALADVRDAMQQRLAPQHWPAPSTRNINEPGSPFWPLLDGALQFIDCLEIDDGGTVIHATALVLQTVASQVPQRRAENSAYLRKIVPEARGALRTKSDPEPVQTRKPAPGRDPAHGSEPGKHTPAFDVHRAFASAGLRADESTGVFRRTSSGILEIRLATHRGPSYATLRENQDAAAADLGDGRVVFALADGVTTSYGSRFAAWTAVQAAVAHLVEHMPPDGSETVMRAVLRDAADAARRLVGECLTHALANLDEETWSLIRGAEPLPLSNARRFMENTLTRKMGPIGPAFASTLVAGVVTEPRDGRQARAGVIRIGDGAVEVWRSADLSARSLFTVDNTETVISAAICPGPVGDQSIGSAQFALTDLEPGDDLIASSDGLTRGHSDPVITTLRNLIPDVFSKFDQRCSALDVLTAAAARADELHRQDGESRLFEDNLALVRITVRRR
ncbi:MAG TPA: protein phosphatase 2C domain-containing protein [Thermoanaerobaculia bacterium]|nr:protein phosphatase 2C domain-containing protein [Thermoanaerobaculia bacterium]